MEKELFLTVANYSLSENAEKYLESLRDTPDTPKHYYDYARWLYPGLVFRLGLAKFPPNSAWKALYELNAISENDRFTEAELSSFEQRRKGLVSVLDQIVNGKPLSDIEGLRGLLLTASQLTREEIFKLESEGIARGEVALYPWTPKEKRRATPALVKPEESGRVLLHYEALNAVFNLACYGLSAFLADEGSGRIKKCPYCERFFPAKDTKRKICYERTCIKEYHRKDMQLRRQKDPVRYC